MMAATTGYLLGYARTRVRTRLHCMRTAQLLERCSGCWNPVCAFACPSSTGLDCTHTLKRCHAFKKLNTVLLLRIGA